MGNVDDWSMMAATVFPPSAKALAPFAIRVTSSDMAVRDALTGILQALAPLGLDVEESGTVELVLAEALNNIIEHAYAPVTTAGPIIIHGDHRPDGLHFQIKDHGRAMPDGHAPLGKAQNVAVNLEDMPEGGFGWFIIRDLAKDVQYRRIGEENQLDLRLAVAMQRSN